MTGEQRNRYQQRIEQAKQEREQQIKQDRTDAANRAKAIWDNAEPAPAEHPYLQKKQVQSHGLRIYKDMLICPVYINSQLRSLQFITTDKKRFLKNGEMSGGYYPIGTPEEKVFICEGFATAATVREVTGEAVVVAYNAKNLIKVAKYIRETKPDLQIIIVGDNDRFTDGNPGKQAAKDAADAVNGTFVLPEFPDEVDGTDFNDLFCAVGPDAVMQQLTPKQPLSFFTNLTCQKSNCESPAIYESDFCIEHLSQRELAFAIAEFLHTTGQFIAVLNQGDSDLFVYRQGVWKPEGMQGVREELRRLIRSKYSNTLRREVADQLKAISPKHRDELGFAEHELAVQNGIVDLHTRELRPIQPEDYALWQMNTRYNPEARPHFFIDVLRDLVPANQEMDYVDTLQEYFGYTLQHGLILLKKCLLLLGPKNAGKSLVANVLLSLFGKENVASESVFDLCNTRWGPAELYGKPLNVRNDLDPSIIKNAGRFKEITSWEDRISAERKGSNKFQFTPKAKLLFTANQAPRSDEPDNAFWDRWITLIFPRSIAEDQQDKTLIRKLTTPEAKSGILNWALDGLDRLRENQQFTIQPEPENTKQTWVSFGGTVERFADRYLFLTGDKKDVALKSQVYGLYQQFAKKHGKDIEHQQTFTSNLKAIGFVDTGYSRFDGKRKPVYQGVRLNKESLDQDELAFESTKKSEAPEAVAWTE